MDYGSLTDHAEAVLALLEANPDLHILERPNGGPTTVPARQAPPYTVVHFVAPSEIGPDLTMRSTRTVCRIFTHNVGANAAAARVVADEVARTLRDVIPTVPGRVCFPIREASGGRDEPGDNESTGYTTYTITSVWRLESLPGRDPS